MVVNYNCDIDTKLLRILVYRMYRYYHQALQMSSCDPSVL